MNYGPVQSWLNRLLEVAVILVVVGLLLNWAWSLIRPLVPVLVITAAVSATVVAIVRRLNERW